ncbi:hypothetical protein FKM82_003872 [Ascaphus truei]|uniref:coiled-coil domain-containing protein 195 n=1 Tax=Ascaphus truei TaxID=8439 RepID=UPI003F5A1E5B
MTVRRYSMSSSLLSYNSDYKHSKNMKRYSSSATLELNGSAQELESDPAEELAIEKDATAQIPAGNLRVNTITKTRSFQEYMHKCRGKVKAVTFLLPMDMSAYTENRINLQGPQNQNVNHLSTIAEKDP